MRHCGVTKNAVCRCSCTVGTRFITPKIVTTWTKTLPWCGTNVAC